MERRDVKEIKISLSGTEIRDAIYHYVARYYPAILENDYRIKVNGIDLTDMVSEDDYKDYCVIEKTTKVIS